MSHIIEIKLRIVAMPISIFIPMPTYVYNTSCVRPERFSKHVPRMLAWYRLWLGNSRATTGCTSNAPIERLFALNLCYNHRFTAAERRDTTGKMKGNVNIRFVDYTYAFTITHLSLDGGQPAFKIEHFQLNHAYSISQEICTRFLLCCALLWLYID